MSHDNPRLEQEIKYSEGLEQGRYEELLPEIQKLPTIEVAEILMELSEERFLEVFPLFTQEQQAQIFSDLSFDLQYLLFDQLDPWQFAGIFEEVPSEIRADFFQEITREEQIQLLPYLIKSVRKDVIELSKYPPETAGGIMSTDFATVLESMSATEAIAKVRSDAPSKKMVYYIYVVDHNMTMKGFITLKDLIMAEPHQKVGDILKSEFVYAEIEDDRETVAKQIEKYDLVAIPVLNQKNQLVGIVTHDEAIEIMRAEHVEDMEQFMGLAKSDEEADYLGDPVRKHYSKRIIWLASLAILSVFSGIIVQQYEDMLAQVLILTLFMPMMTATGGNTGSQAATVVITALSVGQITLKNWLRIIFKESRVGVLLGLSLGVLTYINVLIIGSQSETPQDYTLFYVAMVVAIAMTIQVFSATLIGACLPLFVKRLGGDPTVAASPAITTFVDITGLIIYFGTATWFFTII